jgi:hypothetical protein
MIIIFTFIYAHCRITTRVPRAAHRRVAPTDVGPPTIGSLSTIAPVLPTWPAPAEIYASECMSLCPRPFYEKKFQTFLAHSRKGPLRHRPTRYTMKNGKRNVKP